MARYRDDESRPREEKKEHVTLDEFDLGVESMRTPDTVDCETTLHLSEPITGRKAVTYIIRRFRRSLEGDTVFLVVIDGDEARRVVLPPKVMRALARQDEQLTAKLRKRNGRRQAAERKARGEQPAFLKKGAA